jgi:hypothetical protein
LASTANLTLGQICRQRNRLMKYYIIITGAAFGLLALAHFARIMLEGAHVALNPIFLLTTIGSITLCVWAVLLLKHLKRDRN